MTKEELCGCVGAELGTLLKKTGFNMEQLCELRLRVGRPVILRIGAEDVFINKNTGLTRDFSEAYIADGRCLSSALEIMSRHSLYACEEELKNGYITIAGGHRLGICGQAAASGGKIRTLKNISSLNLRVTREIKGCADSVINMVALPRLKHCMVISPPLCGKTTLLRDIIRQLSGGTKDFDGVNVGVVDERSELAGSYRGVPQNDLGIRTDILDAAPKAEGMMLMLRSMSPQLIAVDEIGGRDDVRAISEIINAGVKLICSAHGEGIDDLSRRPHLSKLIKMKVFELYIVLGFDKCAGVIKGLYDSEFKKIIG